MRVLVVGFGSMGKRHAANALALGHDVRIYDTSPQRVYDLNPGMQFYYSQERARKDFQPDAIIVATPASQHVAAMRDWLATPMLVEKPLAPSVAEIEAMHMRPEFVWVGYNWRHHPEVLAWREVVGQPEALKFACDTDMREWPGRGYAEPTLELSHEIDLLRWWRAPSEVTLAMAGTLDGGDGIFLQFNSGDVVDLRWSVLPSRRMAAYGTYKPVRRLWPSWEGAPLQQSYRDELAAFLRWVECGHATTAGCTLDDGLAVLRICEQAKAMAGATR